MQDTLQNILSSLPHSPGVYQYFDTKGEIIYVGKSKNLKSRVNSYFSGQQKLNFAKKKMVGQIADIHYIVTNTEVESLILENDLIKKHQPKYNILLKDDKNFLYIKVTKGEYPQIVRTRISPSNIKKSDGKYYGPYISGYHVSEIFKLLKKIFGYGVGKHNFFLKKGSYNLDKYIFEGNADDTEKNQKNIYLEKISQIQKFLSGDTREIKQILETEMKNYAEKLEFEQAQKRKISLEALTSLEGMQIVRDGVKGNYFVVQTLEKYEKQYVGIIKILEGKIVAYENMEIENKLEESPDEILANIIENQWIQNQEIQKLTFLLPRQVELFSSDISCEIPQIGAKYELLKLCYKNIYEYAHKKHISSLSAKSFSKATMQHILDILGYSAVNKDIIFECNDISHLAGTHTVASRSVIENGKKNTSKYKKFRIKTLEQGKIDDFDSMREIMSRRILELEKLGNYPDLIVIDGGKGQLGAVMEILKEHPNVLQKLQIVSLAKREEELFLPYVTDPIILKKDSSELRLIQSLRDEAHRFAISFNRDSRISSQKKSVLEAIPGIGPVTRKKILKHFGSTQNLANSDREEVQKVLGKSVVENLENHGII